MSKRPVITALLAAITFVATMGFVNSEHVQVNLFGKALEPVSGIILAHGVRVDPAVYEKDPVGAIAMGEATFVGKLGRWSYCDYNLPENPEYKVELIATDIDENIQAGQVFRVSMTFKNTGNARLFSSKSDCSNGMPIFNVGTANSQDRQSVFGSSSTAMSGWTSPTRIKMQNDYIDPEQDFTVMFQSIAPEGDNIYKEWFQPVVENVAWISVPFGVEIIVGKPSEGMIDNMSYVKDAISIAASSLEGKERIVDIDLSEQKMRAVFGDIAVWTMPISSGQPVKYPTPTGSFKISSKQELRIGGEYPHYRMPYFMMWRKDGYGIHSLPYLANDGGTFWTEAREHIGKPVSHGCVRVLPEDASVIYAFSSIGTQVIVHQ